MEIAESQLQSLHTALQAADAFFTHRDEMVAAEAGSSTVTRSALAYQVSNAKDLAGALLTV